MKYDYMEAMKQDIIEAIEDEYLTLDLENYDDAWNMCECIYDHLWLDDSVTGNASGSYTFDRWKAEENLNGNLSLMVEAFEEFDDFQSLTAYLKSENFEAIDVTIRCYLLHSAIAEVLKDKGFEL